MIKCNVTVCGTISKAAVVRTNREQGFHGICRKLRDSGKKRY